MPRKRIGPRESAGCFVWVRLEATASNFHRPVERIAPPPGPRTGLGA